MDADKDAILRLYRWAILENIATLAATVALTLGLFAMGAGGWSTIGLLCLVNINTPRGGSKVDS